VGLASLLRSALCIQETVIERVCWEGADLIVHVRPRARDRDRCSRCRRRCRFYDRLRTGRRWRSMDLGSLMVFLVTDTHRVVCPEHGVVVAHVPWARHGSRFTLAFEDLACWLATHCNQTVAGGYLRTTWRSIGHVIEGRVTMTDWPVVTAQLKRIGIDEISYRKGQRYLTVVVDHDSGRLVWAAPGRSKETVGRFFDLLGPERCAQIEIVTRDAATWISTVVSERCPQAAQCMDPFHVVKWATEAVDAVRRELYRPPHYWSRSRRTRAVKGARWILLRNRGDLSSKQSAGLAEIQRTNRPLYRAYLLKEQLRLVFQLPVAEAMRHLDRWLVWARRSQIARFVALAHTITEHRDSIRASIERGASNGRVEAMNTGIRLLARKAYGFHSPDAMIALAMLKHGGLCPPLPGRTPRFLVPV
jgi:transposase